MFNNINQLNIFNEFYFSESEQSIQIEEENKDKNNKNIEDNNGSEFTENKENKNEKKKLPAIGTMKRLEIKYNSEVECFSSINNQKYLVLGLKSGKIEILEIMQEDNFKKKLKIKEFDNEIRFICVLDINLFAATDGKIDIKIIKLINNIKNYIVIQTINLNDDIEFIYTMINLPISFYNNNNKYNFCIGEENHILIWESNKQSKNDDNKEKKTKIASFPLEENEKNKLEKKSNNKEETLYFTLIKDIELNTLTHCIIEVNEKYIAAACPKEKTIKFFNSQNNFKQIAEVKNIPVSSGSSILSMLYRKNILIVGCINGFCFISTKDFTYIKNFNCNYVITFLKVLSESEIICCCSEKNNNIIKHYIIDENSLDLKKSSERNAHNNEIWHLKIINNSIFFITNNKDINYYK